MTDPNIRLAAHFPFAPQQCKEVSESFFKCLSDKTVYEYRKDVSVMRGDVLAWSAVRSGRFARCGDTPPPQLRH